MPYVASHQLMPPTGFLLAILSAISFSVLYIYSYYMILRFSHLIPELLDFLWKFKFTIFLVFFIFLSTLVLEKYFGLGELSVLGGLILIPTQIIETWKSNRRLSLVSSIFIFFFFNIILILSEKLTKYLILKGIPVYLSVWSFLYSDVLVKHDLYPGWGVPELLGVIVLSLIVRRVYR